VRLCAITAAWKPFVKGPQKEKRLIEGTLGGRDHEPWTCDPEHKTRKFGRPSAEKGCALYALRSRTIHITTGKPHTWTNKTRGSHKSNEMLPHNVPEHWTDLQNNLIRIYEIVEELVGLAGG